MGFGQHERVSPVSARDLDAPDLQCLLINPYVYLAPDASFGAAMLARVPLAFTRCLDACAVDGSVVRCCHDTAGSPSASSGGDKVC